MIKLHVRPEVVVHKVHNTLLHVALGFFALDLAGSSIPPLGKFLGNNAHVIVAVAAFFEVTAVHLEALVPKRKDEVDAEPETS